MDRYERLRRDVRDGRVRANVRFENLRALLRNLGFEERIRGSHHIFRKAGVAELVNLQSDGSDAKPYQIRQVRRLIRKYRLGEQD